MDRLTDDEWALLSDALHSHEATLQERLELTLGPDYTGLQTAEARHSSTARVWHELTVFQSVVQRLQQALAPHER